MKTEKKLLSVILATLMMVFSMSAVFAFAENEKPTPVIVVGGYSSSDLFLYYGTENE